MAFLAWTSQVILLLLGLFLMIVVLLQRGRGGGLAVPSAGWGGRAFGTKAGDVFTKITIVVAPLWVITAGASGLFLRAAADEKGAAFGSGKLTAPATDPDIPVSPGAGSVPASPTPPAGKQADAGTTAVPTDTTEPAAIPEAGDGEASSPEPLTTEPASGDKTPSEN